MSIGFKQSTMNRYRSDAGDAMSKETCSENDGIIKNQDKRKIKKIKIPRGLLESKIRKDLPRRLRALKSIKMSKRKLGLNPSKNPSGPPLNNNKIFKTNILKKINYA